MCVCVGGGGGRWEVDRRLEAWEAALGARLRGKVRPGRPQRPAVRVNLDSALRLFAAVTGTPGHSGPLC